jgi:riboflavin kinase/FMN adenylyltransferase
VHLIGFEGDIYGETLTVRLVTRLRDEQRFSSIDALVVQLRHDVAAASTVLGERGTVARLVA